MAEAKWTVDVSQIDALTEALHRYGDKSGQVVQCDLSSEGFDLITTEIQPLIHASGRTWGSQKSKTSHKTSATAAARTSVFRYQLDNLSMTVASQSRYGYLYFPDDGSNTIHHVGNQQFMLRGAEAASDRMVDDLVQRLVAAFEEG